VSGYPVLTLLKVSAGFLFQENGLKASPFEAERGSGKGKE
jgi:hypothetical protein